MVQLPPPPSARATEVKQKLGGAEERFPLERWLATSDLFVGRWLAEPGNSFGAAAGLSSWGVWWRTRPFGVYRIHDPQGALRLYRVDVVQDVRIDPSGVRYRDLLLDARIHPPVGPAIAAAAWQVRLEDEDEVAEAIDTGLLDSAAQRRLRWTRAILLRAPQRIVDRADAAILQAIASVSAGPHDSTQGGCR